MGWVDARHGPAVGGRSRGVLPVNALASLVLDAGLGAGRALDTGALAFGRDDDAEPLDVAGERSNTPCSCSGSVWRDSHPVASQLKTMTAMAKQRRDHELKVDSPEVAMVGGPSGLGQGAAPRREASGYEGGSGC